MAALRNMAIAEAAATGVPVLRYMHLEYPDEPAAYYQQAQFMVGSQILFAPVMAKGADTVDIYLPTGVWHHVWTNKAYGSASGASYVRDFVAPLYMPAVFVKWNDTDTSDEHHEAVHVAERLRELKATHYMGV